MNGKTRAGLFFISFSLLFFSAALFLLTKQRYSRLERFLPEGSKIGSFDLSNAKPNDILPQIEAIYAAPVELIYSGQRILVRPDELGFSLDLSEARSALNDFSSSRNEGSAFISYLFGKNSVGSAPLKFEPKLSCDDEQIRRYLTQEIAPRYDLPALPNQPTANGAGYYAGRPGHHVDTEAAVPLIHAALLSTDARSVELPIVLDPQPAAKLSDLEWILRKVIDTYQDEGQITEIYLSDPATNGGFDFARRDGQDVQPEIAFTAASTMKLPIMISSYARMDEEPNTLTKEQLRLMITESKNDQTDWMMENIVGGERAPLTVTEDMRTLGMKNSFLAGYFYLGAPLLDLVETEANKRVDINLKPDVYNQTTAKDMGTLMDALYRCDHDFSGKLTDTFPDQITQEECHAMIELLKNNHLPYLISAGVPENVPVAHKHGWIEENDGLLHTMSNIGAVYSSGGEYILSIYTWHPENLIFDEGNKLFSHISSAVYEYFNPSLTLSGE